MELIGKCKDCLGCNKLENPNFKGTYRCEYATTEYKPEQMQIKELVYERNLARYRRI